MNAQEIKEVFEWLKNPPRYICDTSDGCLFMLRMYLKMLNSPALEDESLVDIRRWLTNNQIEIQDFHQSLEEIEQGKVHIT